MLDARIAAAADTVLVSRDVVGTCQYVGTGNPDFGNQLVDRWAVGSYVTVWSPTRRFGLWDAQGHGPAKCIWSRIDPRPG